MVDEALEQAAAQLEQGKAAEQPEKLRQNPAQFLEQEYRIPPEISEEIAAEVSPLLAGVETITGYTPDPEVLQQLFAFQLTERATRNTQIRHQLEALTEAVTTRWRREPNTLQITPNDLQGQPVAATESPEAVAARLARVQQEKEAWELRVAQTEHQQPSRVAAAVQIHKEYATQELDPSQRERLIAKTVEMMEHLRQSNLAAEFTQIPPEQQDQEYWLGLASVAMPLAAREVLGRPWDEQERRKNTILTAAADQLTRRLDPPRKQSLEQILNSTLLAGSRVQRLSLSEAQASTQLNHQDLTLLINNLRKKFPDVKIYLTRTEGRLLLALGELAAEQSITIDYTTRFDHHPEMFRLLVAKALLGDTVEPPEEIISKVEQYQAQLPQSADQPQATTSAPTTN